MPFWPRRACGDDFFAAAEERELAISSLSEHKRSRAIYHVDFALGCARRGDEKKWTPLRPVNSTQNQSRQSFFVTGVGVKTPADEKLLPISGEHMFCVLFAEIAF